MSFFQTKKVGVETLGEYLRDTRIALRLTIPQVIRLSQIPEKFLRSLEEGDYERLPADVYVKGFLKTLAAIYRVPSQVLLEQFEQERGVERNIKKSDPLGRKNETGFHIPRIDFTPKIFSIIVVIVLAAFSVGYLVWQVGSISAAPDLVLEYPDSDISILTRSLLLRGQAEAGSRVYINGQEILVEEDGNFQQILNLSDGANNLLVSAQNKFGKTSSVERTIVVTPPEETASSTAETLEQNIVLRIFIGPNKAQITVKADGQEILNREVAPGEVVEAQADDELFLSTDNAGSTQVTYNGQDLGVLGKNGETLTDIKFVK